jgi:hypothetical protein
VAGEPHGVEDVRDVLLAVNDHDPGIGQGGGHGSDVGGERVAAVRAGQQQGRDGDPGRPRGIEGHPGDGPELADDRGRGRDPGRPGGLGPEGGDLRLGHPHDLAEHGLDDRVVVPLGQQRVQPLANPRGELAGRRVGGRPTLVQDQPPDAGGQGRRAERAQPAEGVAVQVDRGPAGRRDRVDHGGDVFELPGRVVDGAVAAGAAAAPVQGVDGRVGLQVR